uniref:BPTI/Kunitz inhibitor domain-containing protein n=1 Tax=Eptatretus burgeri TaxID=7764 RepID=A0A8C4QAN0_EPTBU
MVRCHENGKILATIPGLSKRQAGAWYSWSEWGPCSRSCGSGVEVRSRSCRSLRPGGVTDCLGPARMHRTCNAEDCPAGSRDFREVQCSKYDEHDLGGRYYKWTPFYGAPNTCELNCQPKGENFYFTQAATVIDGTPCEPDKPDICIEGVCRELGCDGQLESGRLRDACGVCDGDDSSCFPVHGAFTDLHLPNAVKSLHGEYYFNGGSTVDYGRVLPGAGTMLRYERGSDDGGVLTPEMVTSTGPTTEPLVIELLTHEMNRGIKYEYYLPHDRKIVTSGVTWSFGSWSECSAECDEGDGCTPSSQAPDQECKTRGLRRPENHRPCQGGPCTEWIVGEWQSVSEISCMRQILLSCIFFLCSVTCGKGTRMRSMTCQVEGIGTDRPVIVSNTECNSERMSQRIEECQGGRPCTNQIRWYVGPWGVVSLAKASGDIQKFTLIASLTCMIEGVCVCVCPGVLRAMEFHIGREHLMKEVCELWCCGVGQFDWLWFYCLFFKFIFFALWYVGHGMCNLPNDPGSCQDFAVKWFFVPESSGCNRFWYGGCDGNGNRFETKEACMMTCGSQAPKIPLFNAEANQQV